MAPEPVEHESLAPHLSGGFVRPGYTQNEQFLACVHPMVAVNMSGGYGLQTRLPQSPRSAKGALHTFRRILPLADSSHVRAH
jgi:hypothetical protein